MGATEFVHEIDARNAREAYDMLIDEANTEYGERQYNGSINTCTMGSCKLSFDRYLDTNTGKAMKYIEDNDYGQKWVANYINLGPVKYVSETIKKEEVPKIGAHFKMKFTVPPKIYGTPDSYEMKNLSKYLDHKVNFDSVTDANKEAINAMKKHVDHDFYVISECVLVDGDNLCTSFIRKKKEYKTMPKLKPMNNRVVYPVYRYVFYGWASN